MKDVAILRAIRLKRKNKKQKKKTKKKNKKMCHPPNILGIPLDCTLFWSS